MKKSELLWSLASLGIFVLFTLLVRQHLFDNLDLAITVKIQDHISHFFDTVFSFFSLIGSAEIISLFLIPLFLKYKWRSVTTFLAYGIGLFIEVVGKTFLEHAGPPHLFFRYDLDFKFPTSYLETLHSYPSGHSYRTIFVFTIWLYLLLKSHQPQSKKRALFVLGLIFCVIMLVSRVSLGEHWTTDVIGGTLLGFGFALGSIALTKND